MANRLPFQDLPQGCPAIEFDTDIVPEGFLLCDIPELSQTQFRPPTGGGGAGADGCPACEDAVATDTDGSVSVDLTCGCWDAGETVAVYTATASATATLSGGSQVSSKLCRYELTFETEPPPGLSGAVTVCKGRAPRDGEDGEDGDDGICDDPCVDGDKGDPGCPACEDTEANQTPGAYGGEVALRLSCLCWDPEVAAMHFPALGICVAVGLLPIEEADEDGRCLFIATPVTSWPDGTFGTVGDHAVTVCHGTCSNRYDLTGSIFNLVHRDNGIEFDIDVGLVDADGCVVVGGNRKSLSFDGMTLANNLATPVTFASEVFVWLANSEQYGLQLSSNTTGFPDVGSVGSGAKDIIPLWHVYMSNIGGWRVLPQTKDLRHSRVLLPERDQKSKNMYLRLDADLKPIWDWVRWHA